MKNNLLVLLVAGTALYACNSGGGSGGNSITTLPAGTYNGTLSNMLPSIPCSIYESTTQYTSDGNGTLSDINSSPSPTLPIGSTTLNLAANPCLSVTYPFNGGNYSQTWNSCLFNSSTNTMTGKVSEKINFSGSQYTCSGDLTLIKQ